MTAEPARSETSQEVNRPVLSIAPGYDPRYLTKEVGKGAENYYLSATAEFGEPPGRWWGPGAEALGLGTDVEIDADTMHALYESFLDPRDPNFLNSEVPDEDKAYLGRKKQKFKSADEILAQKLQAEPEASAERRKQLRIEANKESRQAVIHHDATFSPGKSVTMLHASLEAAARQAEEAGRHKDAVKYRNAAQVVLDGVDVGGRTSLNYLREHAGDARFGYHGTDVEGRTTGKWMGAGGWVAARFLQHTNREGEPQLHIHQAILNRQECADGKWRGLDGKALYRVRPAAGAVGERAMEEHLSRMLGVEWRSRPDGQGRELVGVSPEVMAEFSSRRTQVTDELAKRIATYEAAHGRAPSARAVFKMGQDATKASRARKSKTFQSRAEQLREWERRTTAKELEALSSIPAKVIGRLTGKTAQRAQQVLADLDVHRVITAAVADAQRDKATFSRYELTRFVNRHLPDYLGGLPPERVEAVLEELTDAALDPAGPAATRLLNAPDVVDIPTVLQRSDGRSMYQAPTAERYTTLDQLDIETALINSASTRSAPALTAEQARAAIYGPEQSRIGTEAGRSDGERTISGSEAASLGAGVSAPDAKPTMRADQAAAVYGILTSARRVDVLVGPAGTGKSFTVAQLAQIWRERTGTKVVGLTTSQNAAWVLAGEGVDDTWNITRWLQQVDAGRIRIGAGQLIVVDEASMVTTDHLARIQDVADRAGAKVVWTGDPAQLTAPGAGGAMRHLVTSRGAYELAVVARFREEWERQASLQLRKGEADVLALYDHQGRLMGGDRAEMEAAAQRAYLADYLAGRSTLLLAPTNEKAAEMSARVRAELVTLGLVDPEGTRLRDGNTAGCGDLVMARQNDQKVSVLEMREGKVTSRALTNRDVLRVAHVEDDGSIIARVIDKKGRLGARVTLPKAYAGEYLELGYAGTVHAAQGRTVDTCHALVDESATLQMLYVMLTRARNGNFAYTATERIRESDLRPGTEQAAERTAELRREADPASVSGNPLDGEATQPQRAYLSVLAAILGRDEASQTAVEAMLAEAQRPVHLGHLGSMWIDVIREHTAESYIASAEARGTLSASEAARARNDEALGTLGRLLRQIEMSGRDAGAILDSAVAERELGSAESVAQVLHWRITNAGTERGLDVKTLDPDERQITGTWRERTPQLGREDLDDFLGRVADAMQRRQRQLGAEAAERPPVWLTEAIGQVPEAIGERDAWVAQAGRVLAYREQYGHVSDIEPIGPAPSRANPEQRAAWWNAYDALGRPGTGVDVAAASLGDLWTMRAAYEREALWAPQYVAEELSRVTIDARERAAEAVRLRARAQTTPEGVERDALSARADGQEALAGALETRRERLLEVYAARQAWHEATEDARLMAMRADAELRRRPDIDAAALPPLHREFGEGQRQQDRQRAVEEELGVHPDQLTLDLGTLKRAPSTAEPQRTSTVAEPPSPEEVLYQRYAMREASGGERLSAATIAERLKIGLGEAVRRANEWTQRYAQERAERDRSETERAAGPIEAETVRGAEAAAEPSEAEAGVHPDQLTLDVFGDAGDRERTAGELDTAVEQARGAQQVVQERASRQAAEREAVQERQRREAEQRRPVSRREAKRQQAKADAERERLEEREAGRGQQPKRGDDPRERSRADEPLSIREALRQRRRRQQGRQQEQHRHEPPSPDQGPGMSR